ncbi:nitrous oxide-stimulated promoter family protein [Shewanella avicenniae]|uniref:Nitrous oxide-stimulated promoter family protein n=1 Tax=Shewanella avicenniae TaxID=2814294 RepID=A0ABX7QPJ4_9GAMM|nr:nitrous oxide-stimulated promoter family protein [Shewanella avicenniae]QSX33389.1 nitrous oxide-stimulated promoter family protein [Shewanella avicenniae]
MSLLTDQLAVELRTIEVMMQIYCRAHHQGQNGLCQACAELLAYAETRLDRCPYGQLKPACRHCPIHCYKAEPKAQVQAIMRYSGPRMLLRHPILALRHLCKERQPFPEKPPANMANRYLRQQQNNSK